MKFKLVAPDYDHLLVTLPERFMAELQNQLEAGDKKGMVGATELRKAAGRVAWLRCQQRSGGRVEEERRVQRKDARRKDHLIPVKRMENARQWLLITKGSPLGDTLSLSCEASVGTSGSNN